MGLNVILPYENKEKKETSLWSQFLDNVLNHLLKKIENSEQETLPPVTVVQPAIKETEHKHTKTESLPSFLADQVGYFTHFLGYMQHQQGAAGCNAIVKNITLGEKIPAKILSNMKNNVGKDFYDTYKQVNGQTFMKYRADRFNKNYEKYAHQQTPFEDAIDRAAQTYNKPKEIIKTQIGIESNFDPNANRGKKSPYKGLLQVNQSYAKKYGVTNLYDPKQNLKAAMELEKDNSSSLASIKDSIPSIMQNIA